MKVQIFFCLTIIGLSMSGFSAKTDTIQIVDPMQYAESNSKFFAEGDSNDPSGWDQCWYDESEQKSTINIRCEGSREILVHGGLMVQTQFNCHYIFSTNTSNDKYQLEFEECL